MNLIEIYDFELDELLENEKCLRDQIKAHENSLDILKEKLNQVLRNKKELQQNLEYNIKFWSRK